MTESHAPQTIDEVMDGVEYAAIDLFGAAIRFKHATEHIPFSLRLEVGRAGLTAKALRLQAQTLELLQEVDALRAMEPSTYGIEGVVVDVDETNQKLRRLPIGFATTDKADASEG